MVSRFSVQGRIVVVTGGLGQLGRQFSIELLKEGAKVVILDPMAKNYSIPDNFKEYLEQDNLMIIESDVTQRDALEQALEEIINSWRETPYGLINNAALDSPPSAPPQETGPFESFPEASWDRILDVNVKGVFLACQVFGKAMAEKGRGSIVNIGSTYGIVSPDHRIYEYKAEETGENFYKPVAYSASKSALVNFTRYLAVYWAKKGVRANLLVLGGVFNDQDEKFLEGYCTRVPMGRMANEDEYNGTIIYLMSEASSYMTGSSVVLDGGWTSW